MEFHVCLLRGSLYNIYYSSGTYVNYFFFFNEFQKLVKKYCNSKESYELSYSEKKYQQMNNIEWHDLDIMMKSMYCLSF